MERNVAAANSIFSSLSFGSNLNYAFSKVACITIGDGNTGIVVG